MTEELIYSKTITSGEISRMVKRILGRVAKNVEVGGDRVRLQFDPPLTQEERQEVSQRMEKLGYYLNEDAEEHERD